MKKVVIGSDHAGYEVKEKIKKELGDQYEFVDLGTNSADAVDYPKYGEAVAKQVALTPGAQGIVLCGNGMGISMVANKVDGIRCAAAYSKEVAEQTRQHNNANMLALGGRSPMMDDPVEIARTFLETDFSGEDRHARRVNQIMDIEKHH
jgi:ribose 5-phosphate isomerase B